MKLNLKRAREASNSGGDFSLITEGRYDLVADAVKQTTARTGTEMMEVTFTVLGPSFQKRKIWRNFPLTEAAFIYISNFLEACGLTELAEAEEASLEEIMTGIQGSKVSGYIETKTNPNTQKEKNEVNNFTAYTGSTEGAAPNSGVNSGKKKLFSN